jgi:hypothetical protein
MPALWRGDDVCMYDVCLGNGYTDSQAGQEIERKGQYPESTVAELPKIPEIRRARRDGRPAAAACAAGRGMRSGVAPGAIAS